MDFFQIVDLTYMFMYVHVYGHVSYGGTYCVTNS